MATDIRTLPGVLSDDATFRQWGAGISAQLKACGLVQTADTGQIDWTTVLKNTTNTIAGYEIYRFDDALQATKPVFIRIEYHAGSTSFNLPSLIFSVGTATNGAGGLVGTNQSSRQQRGMTAAPSGTPSYSSYCSGGSGRIALVNNYSPAEQGRNIFFVVERPKDGNGVAQGDCFYMLSGQGGGASAMTGSVISFTGAAPFTMTAGPALSPTRCGPSNVGSDVAMSPWFLAFGKWMYLWPLTYVNADLTALAPISLTHLGAVRTFLPLGSGSMGSQAAINAADALAWAMPWE